ncbi:HDOD domain-containing protein [uncultured Helicobacter sp.]|uniref:HDOD domain-containing protein n=1 Tax=uncultured Helicobacter sp. TaxID=175537 RepID=UPI00260B6B8F|nr:HDOD domain-containing protein [uncultured Helicobacter sp.]
MNDTLLTLVEQNLPPLPDTVIKLRDYIDEKGSKIELSGVVDIISKDPLATANLLKTANSAYYGFSQEISTINQVIALLGIENVKNIIMADSLRSRIKINVSPYGLDTNLFVGNCAKEVDFISSWLNEEDKKLAQTLIPCAMLLRLGMILFSSVLIKSRKDKEFLAALKANEFKNIALVEQDFFGVDHISFLAYCFDHWKFDELLIQTVVYVINPHSAPPSIKKNAYALAIANRIFEPYEGGNDYNTNEALALLKEAVQQDVSFDEANLIKHIPNFKPQAK